MPALKISSPPASADEARDYFPVSFWYYHRAMGNILQRNGFTLEALGKLRAGNSQYAIEPAVFTTHMHGTSMAWWSWKDLFDLKGVGPKRLLELVNYLRSIKTELAWFADFDEFTKDWTALQGCHREPRQEEKPDVGH